jgi:hypothetical protein
MNMLQLVIHKVQKLSNVKRIMVLFFNTWMVDTVLRIRIRSPGSGAFSTPGSGMGKKIRIRIHDEQPGSYFRED